MLDTIRRLRIVFVNMVEDVEDSSLCVQFSSLETAVVSQTGPFIVAAKNLVFS